jgi:iron complex transport system ATP-binding protein
VEVLALKNVQFGYPRRPVLQGVSCEFPTGVVTAIIGPNGAGKSTLLRVMLGLLAPSAGEVTRDGKPVGAIAQGERARTMAYVPQNSQVAFPFSVAEVVRLGRYAAGEGDTGAIVRASLERLDLSDRAGDLFGQLSAGQQQRVTVARALAQLDGAGRQGGHGSRFLLADEPVSAMDPSHALRTMDVLRDLAAEGVGVAVVLHDLSLVLRNAPRVVVLTGEGRVAAAGETVAVLTPELLERVYGVRFRRLIDQQDPGKPGALLPAEAL